VTAHTYMSENAIVVTIDAMQASEGKTFPIALNYRDFSNLMWTLHQLWHHVDDAGVAADLAEWAGSMASGIASTLGVEMI
jgi:hypothetical protein